MVKTYFENEKKEMEIREAGTKAELRILHEAEEMIRQALDEGEEKERICRYIAGLQNRDYDRLKILKERQDTVSRILELIEISALEQFGLFFEFPDSIVKIGF